ncbi:MAG: cohesin domain-containing protein [Minisyncoccia bacterium]|jgi:hypothetical protein
MRWGAAIAVGTTSLLVGFVVPAAPVLAAGASLSFGPSSGSYAVGSTFTVNVLVDSGGGVGINAADGKISFDPSLLAVQSVSKDNSVFNLWVADPSYSNSDGTVNFSGGVTSAYAGNAGTIMSITFKAQAAGTAGLKFLSASSLAADGQGTNVLGGTGTASFAIGGSGTGTAPASVSASTSPSEKPPSSGGASTPAETPFIVSIAVSSPTHPDQQKWYANDSPTFTWQLTSDVAGVSTAFDKSPTTYPKRSSEGLISSKQYSGIHEGVSYFHVRFEDSLGNWSDPVHYQVQIDLAPPQPFTVNAQPGGGLNGLTLLSFNATDTVSGIDHYEANFDGVSSTVVALSDIQNGVYTAPPLLPGKHTVVIRAVDKAGNFAEAHAAFEIPGIAMPKITNFPATIIERSPIVLEGIADSNANVTVDILDSGKVVTEGKMVADQTGHWLFALEGGLPTGNYDLGVTMVTTQGAAATSTDKTQINVIAAPFLDRFGWAVIVALFFMIVGLVGFGFYRKKILDMQFALAKRENEEIREKTEAVFEALREEVEEKVNQMDGGAAQAQGAEKLEPEHVLDALRNALTVSESTIQKEVDDVDKALKGE